VRRVGVLRFDTEDDRLGRREVAILRESLEKLEWSEGPEPAPRHPLRGRRSWAGRGCGGTSESCPDMTVGLGMAATRALQRQTQTVPIVFTNVGNPAACRDS
jgi:hypothetical protein